VVQIGEHDPLGHPSEVQVELVTGADVTTVAAPALGEKVIMLSEQSPVQLVMVLSVVEMIVFV